MTNTTPAGDRSPHRISPEVTTTRPGGLAGTVRLQAATPEAVLAVIPHLLGFYPNRSLVVLGLGERGRVIVTFRYDLPDPPDHQLTEDIGTHASFVLNRASISAALLVGYGPAELAESVARETADHLLDGGMQIKELLRADGGRYWSLLCVDAACCPPEGRPYDPGSHPAAATMAEAGLRAEPDRDALARTLQRPAGTADVITRATSQSLARLARVGDTAEAAGDCDAQLRATRIGRREVQQAIRLYRSGGRIESAERLAWLAVLLGDIRVRDDAWARMHPAFCDQHRRLWTDVVRSAALDYLPAPASLPAFTAWQSGNGALAALAVDRALGADPGYSMAQLLSSVLEAALPPSAALMPMTPAQVAASYAPAPSEGAHGRHVRRVRRSTAASAHASGKRSGSVHGRGKRRRQRRSRPRTTA